VASALEITEGTFKSRLSLALAALRADEAAGGLISEI
jgi:DNA-directed RNA polymerase specialized sigma24 family protein